MSASCSGSSAGVVAHDRLGHVHFQRLLPSRVARAQHVERDPRDHRREPAAEVLDPRRVGAAEAQPGLLHGVVGLAHGAEHAVGHGSQVRPVGLEPLRHPVVLVHRSHPMVALRHGGDEPNPINVTRRSTVGSNSPHHDRRWLILAVIGIAQLMVVFDVTIVPSAASLTDELPA